MHGSIPLCTPGAEQPSAYCHGYKHCCFFLYGVAEYLYKGAVKAYAVTLVAGLAYEVTRIAGKSRSPVVGNHVSGLDAAETDNQGTG